VPSLLKRWTTVSTSESDLGFIIVVFFNLFNHLHLVYTNDSRKVRGEFKTQRNLPNISLESNSHSFNYIQLLSGNFY
jgi:hypothetical protein